MKKISLKNLRKKKGLTQLQVAREIGCTVQTVRDIEWGSTQGGKTKEAVERFLNDKS